MMNEQVIKMISLVVAVTGAIVSVYFSLRARRDAKVQRRMQVAALKRQYYSALQQWADQVVDALTEAIFLCDLDSSKSPKEFSENHHSIKVRLSALIDRGRWFIPNEAPDKYGKHKHPASRGFRRPALNFIVAAFGFVEGLDEISQTPNSPVRTELWNLRKSFVSELQNILDPRQTESELKGIIGSLGDAGT